MNYHLAELHQSQPLIVAVSGGIDSAVLLDLLVRNHPSSLIVSHVNHGIRSDSNEDEAHVATLASKYELPFYSTKLYLKASSSEETARDARYEWLDSIAEQYKGVIATAHHLDDVIETMLLNITRGTGWRGLASLRSVPTRYRPLLGWSKAEIVQYAIDHNLEWREDSTNEDVRYTRNYLRHGVVRRLSSTERARLIEISATQLSLRQSIDIEVKQLIADIQEDNRSMPRYQLIMLPDSVALEVLREFLPLSLTRLQLQRLLWIVKTARAGTTHEVGSGQMVRLTRGQLIV